MTEIGMAIYLAVAAIICVGQWIDNTQTHYVGGNPSGIAWGLMWPIWVPIALGALVFSAIRRRGW